MIFNIHQDSGDRVSGTVIPDSFSAVCRIRVLSRKRELKVFPTDEFNPGARELGLHETGMVDFSINEKSLPGLSKFDDLELREAESGLLLYRRFRPGMIRGKFLRLEMQLSPLSRLDDALKDRFQQFYDGIEGLGRAGTTQIFNLTQPSIYASGRIFIKNFMFCVNHGFKVMTLIRDPYEELADRLIFLGGQGERSEDVLEERERLTLRPAIEFVRGLSLDDERATWRALRRMPMEVALTLSNPAVRQLTAHTPDEQTRESAVAGALDTLSQFDLVGLGSEPGEFRRAFSELIGEELDEALLAPSDRRVASLANAIRHSGL